MRPGNDALTLLEIMEIPTRPYWWETLTDMEKDRLTLEQIFEIEPALRDLEKVIQGIRDDGGKYFCANEHWYGYRGKPNLKRIMNRLVGFHCGRSALQTMHAHHTVYQHLFNQLPDCRNCGCFGW